MNTIFMNFKISKTSNTHRLLFNLPDKINLKRRINMLLYQILDVALSNLKSLSDTWENIKVIQKI